MKTFIKSQDRGHADHGWLKSQHTFSFADYYNPSRMNFGPLRVINEDYIAGGMGFGMHPHRDMEIITYVVQGALQHKDSMGTEAVIQPGEVQKMSAGTGIRHSEYNHMPDQKTHLLQIWILPDKEGLKPGYEQKSFASELAGNELTLVGSKNGRSGSIVIHQDMDLYAAKTTQAGEKKLQVNPNRRIWVQNIGGRLQVDDLKLEPGDGLGLESVDSVLLKWGKGSEFLLFDLPESMGHG